MKLSQIVHDREIAAPDPVWVLCKPIWMTRCRHAVIGMVESRAGIRVGSENSRDAAIGTALWPLRKF